MKNTKTNKTTKTHMRILFFLKCKLAGFFTIVIYNVFRLLPLKKQVVSSSFYGKTFGNNTKYVVEKIHDLDPNVPIYWIATRTDNYFLPGYIKRATSKYKIAALYARSKVVLNTHFVPLFFKRRKKQLYVMMYHGGIGIKKNSNSVVGRKRSLLPHKNAINASYIISNSLFMNGVIRECLEYHGPIWMVGYPKNDILHIDSKAISSKVRSFFGLKETVKIVLYAPTYRLDIFDFSAFDIDFNVLLKSLEERFGGEWVALLHLHPHQKEFAELLQKKYDGSVINANRYEDIQELILSCDCMISDYSSCIFEAAERDIPCFTYASDYDKYKEIQGFFFEIDALPFPYCANNKELEEKIKTFDTIEYLERWHSFKKEQGLIETSNSSSIIARKLIDYLDNRNSFNNEKMIYE